MTDAYRILKPNRYLSAQIRLIREWSTHDVVIYSQLVDLTAVERERERRRANGLIKPSYTAFVIDSIARALRDHPKLNRMIYRGLTGYRYTQFKHVDVVIAVEVVQDDLDIAYGSILRDVDRLGLDGIAEALQGLNRTTSEAV